jgi:plastocyanin
VLHCFIIGGLNVKTTRNLATGESETLTFTPRERGAFSYACLMHPMMVGKIVVE